MNADEDSIPSTDERATELVTRLKANIAERTADRATGEHIRDTNVLSDDHDVKDQTMRLYLISPDVPPDEHIDPLIVSAETPEQAFELWTAHYGYGWPCHCNEIPPVSHEAQIENWNPPVWLKGEADEEFVVLAVIEPEDED